MPPKATSVEQRNQATDFSEDIMKFLSGQMSSSLSGATDLQRTLGTAITQFINSGGMPFDVTPQADALQDIFALDRSRGLNDVAEQFGSMGSRMGTPIGVGSARFLEGIIPQQENVLGNLFLQAHEGAANRMLGAFGAGNQTAAGIFNPFMGLAGAGIVNPYTQVTENPWLTAGKAVAGAAGGAGFGSTDSLIAFTCSRSFSKLSSARAQYYISLYPLFI